jgi:hypothetical protein
MTGLTPPGDTVGHGGPVFRFQTLLRPAITA